MLAWNSRRGIPAKSDPRHGEVQLAHGRVREGEEPRIVLPLRYPQHGVHANIHLMDAGEGVVARRSDAHAAARDPAVVQLPIVAQAKVDAPEIPRAMAWPVSGRMASVSISWFRTPPVRLKALSGSFHSGWVKERFSPTISKIGRLPSDGDLGEPEGRVADGVGRGSCRRRSRPFPCLPFRRSPSCRRAARRHCRCLEDRGWGRWQWEAARATCLALAFAPGKNRWVPPRGEVDQREARSGVEHWGRQAREAGSVALDSRDPVDRAEAGSLGRDRQSLSRPRAPRRRRLSKANMVLASAGRNQVEIPAVCAVGKFAGKLHNDVP